MRGRRQFKSVLYLWKFIVDKAPFKSPAIWTEVPLRCSPVFEVSFTTSIKPSPSNTRASGKTPSERQNGRVASTAAHSASNISKLSRDYQNARTDAVWRPKNDFNDRRLNADYLICGTAGGNYACNYYRHTIAVV